MIHRSKIIVILWIHAFLEKNGKITTKDITSQFDITDRQFWCYMSNVKKYYKEFSDKELVYSKSTKEYYLQLKSL